MSILFAATYPERTRSLVLYGTYAKRRDPDDDYPWAPTSEERERVAVELERTWGENVDLSTMAPGADDELRAWFGRLGRAASQPRGRARPDPDERQGRRARAPAERPVPDARAPPLGRPRRTGRGGPLHRRSGSRARASSSSRGDDHVPVDRPGPDRRRGRGVPHRLASGPAVVPRADDDPVHRSRRLDGAGAAPRRRVVGGAARPATTRSSAPSSPASRGRSSTPRATGSWRRSTGPPAQSAARSRSATRCEPLGLASAPASTRARSSDNRGRSRAASPSTCARGSLRSREPARCS